MIRAAALLAGLVLAATTAVHAQAPGVPLPADVAVTPPGADVPPEIARFSGAWAQGAWDNVLPHVLVVERVAADGQAAVVYAVGEATDWGIQPGHTRVSAVIANGVLRFWLRGDRVTVQYRFDGGRLRGRYAFGNDVATVALSPITLAELAAAPPPARLPVTPRQTVRIPLAESGGKGPTLEATVFRPAGNGPFPVVVFNHGSTGGDSARIKLTLPAARQARFFTERGFAVVAPMRRGRGASDGHYGESYGCDRARLTSGLARAVEDLDAVVAW